MDDFFLYNNQLAIIAELDLRGDQYLLLILTSLHNR